MTERLTKTDSTLYTLVKNGFFMAAENLIKCGRDLQYEDWIENFDMDTLDLSTIHVNYQSFKRVDMDVRKAEFYEVLTNFTAKSKRVKTLSSHCRSILRETLQIASKGAEISSRIAKLPIPQKIKSFVDLDEDLHASEIIVVERPRHMGLSSSTWISAAQVSSLFNTYYDPDSDDYYGYRTRNVYMDYDDYNDYHYVDYDSDY